ncbi:MAG TPA: TatD family hydrolase [Candidatus Paceibacterota bacterium]|nr:TatD family hydrolase [Candidatus Paceibacterota bacterium]
MEIRAIDSHCHPQFPHYDADRSIVIQRALDAGVGMICVGTDLATSVQAVRLAEEFPPVWASVGLHPNDASEERYDERDYERLIMHPKVIAMGEIGLDFHRQHDPEVQERLLRRQLELAGSRLPCIIHCRDAHQRMSELLREYQARGVIHSFTGTSDEALSYVRMGWYIGLNGIVSFSAEYEEMVKALPMERILLETDAPYLAPVPHRGRRNEPLYVLDVADRIATIRGTSGKAITDQCLMNTYTCFSMHMSRG